MNLINETITHKVFGKGIITDNDGSIVTIHFGEKVKQFVYPYAFGKFIQLNNEDAAEQLHDIIVEEKEKEAAHQRELEEERERLATQRLHKKKQKSHKAHESSQIAFWLDEGEKDKVLTDWQVFTGQIKSGKNKGQPNKVARASSSSICLLTERDSNQPETERKIVGLYMAEETFAGGLCTDGLIPAHHDFRVKLTDEESKKMLFWNYYMDKNYPERITWNSGRLRYFDNVWAAQILQDIIKMKTNAEEQEQLESFLKYFCRVNALNINNIPTADGALKQ